MSDLTKAGPLRFLVLLATVGTIAWALAAALAHRVSATLLMAMALLTVLEAQTSWQVTSERHLTRQQLRSMRMAELVLAFAAVKVGQLVIAVPSGAAAELLGRSPFDSEAIIVWLTCVGLWIFALGTISDLDRLGSPAEPAPDYRPPLPSITGRFLAGGIAVVVAGALYLVDIASIPDPFRAPARAWFWPAALYFVTVILVLGAIRQQETQLQWKRQGMEVAPEVATRWWAGVAVVAGIAMFAMTAAPLARGGSALGFAYDRMAVAVAWAAGGLGIDIDIQERETPLFDRGDSAQQPLIPTLEGSPAGDAVDVAVGVLFLLPMVLLAFAVARLLRGLSLPVGGLAGSGLGKGIVAMLWAVVTALPRLAWWAITALVAWVRRALRRGEHVRQPEASPHEGPTREGSSWRASDPYRLQVAEIYRRFLHTAGSVLISRRRSETPIEYRQTVTRLGAGAEPVNELTERFNEARYSTHSIGDAEVERAKGALGDFETQLRDREDRSGG